ncbi:MAG: peptidoglycan D,D-transpeptidase FtsI family protein [Candidatus Dormibacteria bacterium]
MSDDRGRLRVLWLMAIAGALALVLCARLTYWQVLQHQRLDLMAARLHRTTVKLPASRGIIRDRSGQPLAFDTPVYNIAAAPDQVPEGLKAATAHGLAAALGLDETRLLAQLQQKAQFMYVQRRVDKATADRVEALHLAGVFHEEEVRRSYVPAGETAAAGPDALHTLASNLLGFVNFDGHPLYGVEQFYDSVLQGHDGSEATTRDGAGRPIVLSDQQRVEPRNGKDLLLTIDSQVQFFAEKALAEGVKRTGSESGSVIVMEPHTGNIVAWADYPTYDANRFNTADNKLFSDPIVSGLYEPGSVMKVVTLSGALDDGAITPGYTFNETGGVSVGGSYIRDWDLKAHGNIDMTYVLAHSLNVGAIKAQQLEGADRFYQYLDRFGFGKLTGVDVANEAYAKLPPLKDRRPNEVATMTFGQGIAVTPIEMISALNTVANGGFWARPRTAAASLDPNTRDAHRVDFPLEPGVPVVSPAAAAQMKQMMVQVVEHGSGWTAKIDGWKDRIAGKTGTANIPEAGKYSGDTIASFAGFMPADNPRFTMLVIMRKPKGDALQQEGTFAAAPTWKQIAQQILLQWQITP